MKTAVVAITAEGLEIAGVIAKGLGSTIYAPTKIAINDDTIKTYTSTTKELVAKIWKDYDNFVFVMALGIVTRIIKDHIEDKHKDPAIVVIDEMGRYAISALSGHEGGANLLAEKISLLCKGDFVVTTGSEATKRLIVGMGCRRGTPVEELEELLMEGLAKIDRTIAEVRVITSVEDKSDEAGLLELSKKLGVPLKFIPKTLIAVIEENFDSSELVKKTLGIGSVAEPSAMLGGTRCQLILKRIKSKTTTLAIAEESSL